jgi:hypothetical protein
VWEAGSLGLDGTDLNELGPGSGLIRQRVCNQQRSADGVSMNEIYVLTELWDRR